MGLAAFNRMRREEAMRPENIIKANEKVIEETKEKIIDEPKEEETVVRRPRRRN